MKPQEPGLESASSSRRPWTAGPSAHGRASSTTGNWSDLSRSNMKKRWLYARTLLAVVFAAMSIVARAQAPQGAPPAAEVNPAPPVVEVVKPAPPSIAAPAVEVIENPYGIEALWKQGEVVAQRLQGSLACLATAGSAAPVVGLFGTGWGIYHALTAIGIGGQAAIDKVAGAVGEALIMTAHGLAVAVPAVLGYNWLVRRN